MSHVTTAPAAISAAATQLEGVGTSFATESSAAAGSTTAIAPAAADEVSILQSGVFSTYGQLYQTVSAQAQAIHQQFVNTLQQSSGSYQETEGANAAGAAANSASSAASSAGSTTAQSTGPITGLINNLTSFLTTGPVFSALNGGGTAAAMDEVGNFASGYSDLIGMGGGGLLLALAGPSTASADLGGLGAGLVGDVGPAGAVGGAVSGAGGMGAAPVLAAAGSGSSIGPLSVPPSWAGGAGMPTASTPVTLASQSWTTPAPSTGGMGPGIAGMPAVANGGRGGTSFGAPRYGVKPKVMPTIPKPTAT
jgi:PE family/PPE-SVP subfamily C-terminal region